MNKKQIIKFIMFCAIFLILLSSMQFPLYALTKTGTIKFVAFESETNNNITNLSVDVYQIGVKNEQGDFVYSKDFENSNLAIDLFTESNINEIKNYAISKAEPIYTMITDSNGEFTISNLQEGAYIFIQASNNEKYTMQTMLVHIPEIDNNGNENYTINIEPKISKIIEKPDTSTPSSNEDDLPYTGVLNWPIPVLVIIAIILFSIGWIKIFTNSKKKVK